MVWKAAHQEQQRVHFRDWYLANREEYLARNEANRVAHAEEIRQQRATYRAAHMADKSAYDRTHSQINHGERLACTAEWKRANPEKAAAQGQERRARMAGVES
ncbi:MAG: hypothetical protein ABSF27_07975 [Candidatus Dormibacteria bacterium]